MIYEEFNEKVSEEVNRDGWKSPITTYVLEKRTRSICAYRLINQNINVVFKALSQPHSNRRKRENI